MAPPIIKLRSLFFLKVRCFTLHEKLYVHVCTVYVHVCTVYVLYMYCICTVFVLYMYCICTVYCMYCICTHPTEFPKCTETEKCNQLLSLPAFYVLLIVNRRTLCHWIVIVFTVCSVTKCNWMRRYIWWKYTQCITWSYLTI